MLIATAYSDLKRPASCQKKQVLQYQNRIQQGLAFYGPQELESVIFSKLFLIFLKRTDR
jgi:hypothetical protein